MAIGKEADLLDLADEAISVLDAYAEEVALLEERRRKGLVDMSPEVKRPFVGSGWMNEPLLGGGLRYVSYGMSNLLAELGLERNRVSHFGYEERHKLPENRMSHALAETIKCVLSSASYRETEEQVPDWGKHYPQTRFDHPNGVYLLVERNGNPIANYWHEPHFTLFKKVLNCNPFTGKALS